MRIVHGTLLSGVLLLFAFASDCNAVDWKAFDDPKANPLTDAFAKAVGDLPTAEKTAAIKRLKESLQAKEVEIRRRAALTLDSLGDKSGVPTLIADLSKATGRDRDNVVVAFRILKDERAVPALRKACKDKSPYVRSIAVSALGELKAAKAYEDMVALTQDKPDKRGKNNGGELNCFPVSPASSACYALGALGDKRAIPVLVGLLDDKDLRVSAIQALEVLTKKKFGNDPDKWKAWWKAQGR